MSDELFPDSLSSKTPPTGNGPVGAGGRRPTGPGERTTPGDADPGSSRVRGSGAGQRTPAAGRPAGPDAEPLLVATGVTRVFLSPAGDVVANADIDLSVRPGELVVVAGPSGAGKTTLLNLLAGLDRPTAGEVMLTDRNYADCSDKQLAQLRREYIGYVFQSFGLLPMLSARENVEVPLRLLRMPAADRDARVAEVLGEVGLAAHLDQRPYELSGGQQQRVSLARALVARPRLLLADEPTGQLDSATAGTIVDLIRDLVHGTGVAAVVATHDELLMDTADRLILLRDGRATAAARRHVGVGGADGAAGGRHALPG